MLVLHQITDGPFPCTYNMWHAFLSCVLLQSDDKGVFSTTLSKEYAIAMATFQLTVPELIALSKDALEGIFEDSDVKRQLEQHWTNFSLQ